MKCLLKDKFNFVPVAVEDDPRLATVTDVFERRTEVVDQFAVVLEASHADHGVVNAPGRCS